ncbi:MAG: baseplate assembly protein [Candidatus Electrothrix sp. ATG2]|nr:baseplate assembly protein [Candidatus Electrothrix sp. ATG2]
MSSGESEGLKEYYGKYRGTVINNIDPEQRGRIMAMVPDVLGLTPSSWAMPCVPIAGKQQGVFMVPQIGAGVWIEFEQGDSNYPIWTGGFWGSAAEVPALALAPPAVPPGQNIVIQSTGQNALVINDAPGPTGGVMLKSTTGASTIIINDTGITITGPTVKINGITVTINNGALVVT